MKIKIIKRSASEKSAVTIPAGENNQPTKTEMRNAAATVKSWIDDLRQKRERERLSFHALFREEHCT